MNPQVSLQPRDRLVALAVAAAFLAPLVVACTLAPSASGMGTHRQLGLPSCAWPTAFGLPCITCGMTTAFAHAVRGEFVSALWTQPAGLLAAFLTAVGAVVALWDALSARPVHRMLSPLARGRSAWIAAALLVAGWGWKIATFRGAVS
jgi:hypothetical protein